MGGWNCGFTAPEYVAPQREPRAPQSRDREQGTRVCNYLSHGRRLAQLVLGKHRRRFADGKRKGIVMPPHVHQILEHIIAHHQAVVAHIRAVIQQIFAHHLHRMV
jgi:hypothetical protein